MRVPCSEFRMNRKVVNRRPSLAHAFINSCLKRVPTPDRHINRTIFGSVCSVAWWKKERMNEWRMSSCLHRSSLNAKWSRWSVWFFLICSLSPHFHQSVSFRIDCVISTLSFLYPSPFISPQESDALQTAKEEALKAFCMRLAGKQFKPSQSWWMEDRVTRYRIGLSFSLSLSLSLSFFEPFISFVP